MISMFAICSSRGWTGLSSMLFPYLEFPQMIARQLLAPFFGPHVTVMEDGGTAGESPARTITTGIRVVLIWSGRR